MVCNLISKLQSQQNIWKLKLLILRYTLFYFFRNFRKVPGDSFSTTFCVWFFKKMFPFLKISWDTFLIFPNVLSRSATREATYIYTVFISNNRASFHFSWKENLVKHQKSLKILWKLLFAKFYVDFHVFIATIVKNSHLG